ncbi:MAG: TIGR03987 family protein [Clostridium sp.]|uniref:HsmA family protein n=1 Tax=Clostridium sp. TaxID=1506 RepID=UPI001DF4262E|nr:HsmA family protein [Clostridium sp.]MBS5938233.1 TIGR03987 family protein [Clostridium sp.]MBS5951260.1 TIGR03987 family protein [Clostridium sp.]
MDIKLIMAIITITLALIFYTIGVFSERKSGTLKKFHVIIFWIGLLFDTTGTTIMSIISNGGSLFSLHGITGALAIILMLFHAVWATIVFIRKDKEKLESFHKFSIVVWLVWLVPYILGMIVGMSQ